ncbi:hypothetical protein [Herpetosiphon sp. NSE202]|uniref:hypothetical protein n=1 Tax=Herpetosiphon sp. NSE202 TaxID=3351349 RepID=UPI00363A5DA5
MQLPNQPYVVIVDDQPAAALGLQAAIADQQLNVLRNLSYSCDRIGSVGDLERQLGLYPPQSIRLMVVDYAMVGRTPLHVIYRLRTSRSLHPALHPEALLIGWSAYEDVDSLFRSVGFDGFISKHLDQRDVVQAIEWIYQQRLHGAGWTSVGLPVPWATSSLIA